MISEHDLKTRLSMLQCILLDMDGTLYMGDELFDFTPDFLSGLKARGIRPIYLTNNSSKSREDYVAKLQRLGVDASVEDIYSSGDATIDYLQLETPYKRVFLLGTPSLEKAFEGAGFELCDHADCVVMGYDKTLTYEKLNRAYHLIVAGKPFFVTHPDTLCPAPGGAFDIDTGAMMQALIHATGVSPMVIGKPEPTMTSTLLKRLGLPKEALAIMGDRLYTDMRTGLSNNILALLVLSGEATREDVAAGDVKPDFILERNIDLLPYFEA